MTRCAFSLLPVLLLGTVLSCRTTRQSVAPTGELIAIVEEPTRLAVLRGTEGNWRDIGSLPHAARALRFSQGAKVVAWIEDDTADDAPRMQAFVMSPIGSQPEWLGALGLRRTEAMGLTVSPRGDVVWLDEEGHLRSREADLGPGTNPLSDRDGLTWVLPNHCLANVKPELCGDALRPLEWRDGVLLARTNIALVWNQLGGVRSLRLRDVEGARQRTQTPTALVIHRVDMGGVARDAASLWSGDTLTEIYGSDIIISAEWDNDSVLLVHQPSRADLYELMLAHAPEEFGGEALSGDAIRYDLRTKTTHTLAGLEGKRVRRLFRADY